MQENHNIEDFFKKRLETHEWPFQEEDWSQLEKQLDAIHPSPSRIAAHITARTIIIIIAALTAAFVLGWFSSAYFQDNSTNENIPVSKEQMNTPSNVVKEPSGNDASRMSASRKAVNRIVAAEPPITAGTASEQAINTNAIFEPVIEDETIPVALISDKDSIEPLPALTFGTEYAYIQRDSLSSVFKLPAFDYSTSETDVAANTLNNLPFRSKWAIGVILAPDYNGVRILQGKTVTTAIGGIISYQFTPRWSASLRILYNNKKYSSGPDYYKLPYGYWINRTNGIIPDNIIGSCRVIDIPFIATYHFIRKKSISFTASAGLGSYFMQDEKYYFEFSQNNPGADTQWQTDKNSRVFLGTANLALGAEFQTTARINLAIEPYLKIPLKEIGWGNVRLYSMGLSFTMKYHL